MLNAILVQRRQVQVLPPQTDHGFPLLMPRHDANSRSVRDLAPATGPLNYEGQLVSLWSPVLIDKTRSGIARPTMVLYGIAQLDARDGKAFDETISHLQNMARRWAHKPLSAAFYHAQDWPQGWPYRPVV